MNSNYRLKKNKDFNRVFRAGKSAGNYNFVLYYQNKQNQANYRFGIVVSKKIGKAVLRNRLKRLIKEAIRSIYTSLRTSHDYVVIAKKPVAELNFLEIKASLAHLFKKGNLYIK